MTLFRSKNVFFIVHTLFSIKKPSNFDDIDYYFRILNHLEYVDLKFEISAVSAHLNYFRPNFKDIQSLNQPFLKQKQSNNSFLFPGS